MNSKSALIFCAVVTSIGMASLWQQSATAETLGSIRRANPNRKLELQPPETKFTEHGEAVSTSEIECHRVEEVGANLNQLFTLTIEEIDKLAKVTRY